MQQKITWLLWGESPTGSGHCRSMSEQAVACARRGDDVIIASGSIDKFASFREAMGLAKSGNGQSTEKKGGGSIVLVPLEPRQSASGIYPDASGLMLECSVDAQASRAQQLLALYDRYKPQVILTDMVPFDLPERAARFEHEITCLMEYVHRPENAAPPLVYAICRDIILQTDFLDEIVKVRPALWQTPRHVTNFVQAHYDGVLAMCDPNVISVTDSRAGNISCQQLSEAKFPIHMIGYYGGSGEGARVSPDKKIMATSGGQWLSDSLDFYRTVLEAYAWLRQTQRDHLLLATAWDMLLPAIPEEAAMLLKKHADRLNIALLDDMGDPATQGVIWKANIPSQAFDEKVCSQTSCLITRGGYTLALAAACHIPMVILPRQAQTVDKEQMIRAAVFADAGFAELVADNNAQAVAEAVARSINHSPAIVLKADAAREVIALVDRHFNRVFATLPH